MVRLVEKKLQSWKSDSLRKPLIIRGARQVGKTYTVKKFGVENFGDNFFVVDFEKNRSIHSIFSDNLDAHHLISQLELFLGKRLIPGESLIFFDEIQACPRALTALRYFYEDVPGLHVIAAGSLLDFALEENSFPVGRVQFDEMHPLSFEEFVLASGNSILSDIIGKPPQLLPESVHVLLLKFIREYMMVGGMPEAVSVYLTTKSLLAAMNVHHDLLDSYLEDFSKYGQRIDRDCLETVLKSIAKSVGSRIKYSHLAEGYSGHTIKRAVQLLERARVITPVFSTSPSGLPLGALKNVQNFKAILVDIGLMHALCGLDAMEECSREKLLSIYNGSLAEQFVGQELRTTQKGRLFYWSREAKSSSAEVDYVVVVDGEIRPVEVKSGTSGKLKSLHLLLETYPACGRAIVLNEGRFGVGAETRIDFMPLYFAASSTVYRST
jgi:predicted AAA+ superfamily ATPase